jgi:hypothetical protein
MDYKKDVEGNPTKRCTKCKTVKCIVFFGRNINRDDKLNLHCKKCVCESSHNRYLKNREIIIKKKWFGGDKEKIKKYNRRKLKKWGDKMRTQARLRYAVMVGKIKKLPCEVCGDVKSQAHHEDYSKTLEVRWLCDLHHKELHGKLLPDFINWKKQAEIRAAIIRDIPL